MGKRSLFLYHYGHIKQGLNRCKYARYEALIIVQEKNDGISLARVMAMDTERNGQMSDILRGDIYRARACTNSGGNTGKGYVHDYYFGFWL